MAVAYRAVGTVASGTAAITAALPTGRLSGDLMFLLVQTANEAVTLTGGDAANWLQLTSSPQGTGTAAGTAATRLTVFYRWVDGTESAPGVGDSGNHQIARIIAYSGVHPTTPFNVQTGNVKATASTAVTFPSVTTTVADCMILLMEAHALPDSTSTAIISGQTNANLSAITERMDNNTNAGNGGGFSLTEGIKATAGATGTTSATLTTSATQGWITLALAPAPAAQTLTQGTRFDNAQTFHNPTVTVGAATLAPVRYDNEAVFYAAEVTQPAGVQSLTATRFDNAQTFHAPTVAPGAVTLTAARYDNAHTFYAHALSVGAVTLTASPVENTSVFYGPVVTQGGGPQTLVPGLFSNDQTFYAATVGTGGVTLMATRFDNAQAFYAPSVLRGPVTLTATRYDNGQTFFAASVAGGPVGLTAARFDNAQTLHPVTVSVGAVVLGPQRFDNTATFYGASLSVGAVALTPDRFDNANVLYGPFVTQGGIGETLFANRLDNANEFFAPSLAQNITFPDFVEPGHVEPGWVGWPYFNAPQFFGAVVVQGEAPPAPEPGTGGGMGVPLRFIPFNPVRPRRPRKRRQEDVLLLT